MLREGTAALLAAQPGLEIAGVAGALDEADALVRSTEIDVVLLDIRLGTDSGLRWLTGPGDARPAVVVLTSYDYPQYADAALRLGASGFVLKTAPIAELVDAIRRAAAGGMSFARRPGSGAAVKLSEREHDVVTLVVEGLSNDEIAARLGIGAKTVEITPAPPVRAARTSPRARSSRRGRSARAGSRCRRAPEPRARIGPRVRARGRPRAGTNVRWHESPLEGLGLRPNAI